MIDLKDIYWVAGFLEGEGSFTVAKKKKNKLAFRVTAVQAQLAPLEKLVSILGGRIQHSQYPRWSLWGTRAIGLMFTLYSIMSPRRQQQIMKALLAWKSRPAPLKYTAFCVRGHKLERVAGKRIRCKQCVKIYNSQRYINHSLEIYD